VRAGFPWMIGAQVVCRADDGQAKAYLLTAEMTS
jgi:hypothetical protein